MHTPQPPFYAGIGSRKTPPAILADMRTIASSLATDGWSLSSGGAAGADSAFEAAAPPHKRRIYLPKQYHNGRSAGTHGYLVIPHEHRATGENIAREYHPAWHRCSPFARMLHTRNTAIILGHDLRTPVRAVICWTPEGAVTGGTGNGMRIALSRGIPVINLATVQREDALLRIRETAARA